MKSILQIIFLCLSMACFAQPTGHQKIYLEITDKGDTIHFENNFRKGEFSSKAKLSFKIFQLIDISKNRTGFSYYPNDEFIHKTLMTDDHEIVLVKNKKDTMRIEILNAFNVYFLSIHFQNGNYRMVVNDGNKNKWAVHTLPFKNIENQQIVYNLTPNDWSVFRLSDSKILSNYFVSEQFEKQEILKRTEATQIGKNQNIQRINFNEYTFILDKAPLTNCPECRGCFCQSFLATSPDSSVLFNHVFTFQENLEGSSSGIDSFQVEDYNFDRVPDFKLWQTGVAAQCYVFDKNAKKYVETPFLVPNNNQAVIHNSDTIKKEFNHYQIIFKQPFKFVLEKNTPLIAIPAGKGYYANKISVYDTNTEKLVYSMVAVGNRLKEMEGCSDSLQIADYNFDGYPDFRVCNNSVPGKHTYYIFHEKRKSFSIEYTLSELNGLSFDFENKTAKGSTDRKEFASYPWDSPYQYFMETLQFKGSGLENLTVTTTVCGSSSYLSAQCKYANQKRIYEGDTIGLMLQRKNLLIKEVGPFKFEIEFNPEEVKTSGEKGVYVKVLNIFKGERNVGHFEMHGNYLKEVPHWLDSMEIADYNFDGFPDIRMYKSTISNGSYSYLLFNSDKDILQFYEDGLLSSAIETEYIPNKKIIKGKIVEPNLTRYYFLKNDTLTITIQDNDLSKPPFIEESIYKNGNRKGLRSAYGKLEPEIKREYGDYNFDGHDDFKQQSKKSPYYWDVFIYNPKKESFEKDTLLSKLEVFEYDKLDKKLQGSFRIKSDETTWITKYYQWSFTESKMILYQENVCYSKFPGGESQRCIISRLVDGKWIETETFGAE